MTLETKFGISDGDILNIGRLYWENDLHELLYKSLMISGILFPDKSKPGLSREIVNIARGATQNLLWLVTKKYSP